MNILIRCDGSTEIGMGHIIRCLALADELKEQHGSNIYFAIRRSTLGKNRIKDYYPILESFEEDFDYAGWLIDCIEKVEAQILILDARDNLALAQLKQIKKYTKIKVITIDDPEDKRLAADMAFYPPVPQLDTMNWEGFNGSLYIGWEYVVLRKEFSKFYPRPENTIPNVLVLMGGSDEHNMTEFVIDCLDLVENPIYVNIILGPGYNYSERLKQRLKSVKNRYTIYENPNSIAKIMSLSDMAVISFGQTAYELVSLKVPTIQISLTNDHFNSSMLFQNVGVGVSVGQFSEVTKEKIVEYVQYFLSDKKLLNQMSEQASGLNVSNLKAISSKMLGQNL